jgi:carbonic anhydrase/acetyltransferase-like protein (isoleucine patch superfamily)
MKYEFTGETKWYLGLLLRRIRYLDDGTLGGWLESEANLSQECEALVLDEAMVYGDASVSGAALVRGEAVVCLGARVYGSAVVSEWAQVVDQARVYGDAQVSGNASVYDEAQVFDYASVFGYARVYGAAKVRGTAAVGDEAKARGNAELGGNACLGGRAVVTGGVWDSSPLQIQGTRHFFSVSSETELTIGCATQTAAEWLVDSYKEFLRHKFTDAQRVEYKRYFNLAAVMYNWDVPLFEM